MAIDDDTPTKPSTPVAKKSSGEIRVGLAVCPQCSGRGRFDIADADGVVCDYCDGAGRVTLTRHHDYVGLKP